MLRRLAFVLVAFCVTLPLFAAETLRNEDIIKLVAAGFEPTTVIQKIRTSEVAFDVSTDALIALKKSGVDEMIVREMLRRQSGATAPEPPMAPPPPPPPPSPSTAPAAAPAPPSPAPVAPMPPDAPEAKRSSAQKFDVLVRPGKYGTCEAKLTVDKAGLRSSGCHENDVKLRWDSVQKICYSGGAHGRVDITTAQKDYILETLLPVTAKNIVDATRELAPKVKAGECN
jgi:hypothetical protein